MQKIPAGYKKTEVGVIPKDWEVKSLDDLFFISGGFAASRAQLSDSGFCYLHYGDIHKSKRTYIDIKESFSEIPKLNISAKLIPRKSILNNGDVVFVDASEDDDGASKHIVIYNADGLTYISGLHTIVLKSKDDSIKNIYKQYCFQTISIKEQFKFYAVGTKVTGISKTNIAKIVLPYPSKPEQTAIAIVLSGTDALIECLEKLIAKKKAIKQDAMQQLLTGKKRLPGFSGEWETKLFGSLIEVNKGHQLNKSELTATGEYPDWNGGIEPSGYTNKWNMFENTITISEGGNSCGFVNYCKQKFWCGGHCYALKITNANLDKFFLYQLLKFKEKFIMSLRIGSGLPNIQKKNLNEFKLFIPKESQEQTAIATILSDMDSEIDKLEQKRNKYIMLRQGMMQQLLTGRIRIYANN